MFSRGPAITLHIIQWDLEPTRSWAVYAIKKLLSPRSSQCRDKILSSQLVYCSKLGHRSQIIWGHAKTIHVPLNLEKAFFTTSGFNQFVVNSERQTHFLGPLKYTALSWGCSCNPNMGIQSKSPATSCRWLRRAWESGGHALLNTAPFSIWESLRLDHQLQSCHMQLGYICGAWTDLSGDPISLHWGGDSLPSVMEFFAKPLSYMQQAPSLAYLCILLLALQPPSCASSLLRLWFCQYGNMLRGAWFI